MIIEHLKSLQKKPSDLNLSIHCLSLVYASRQSISRLENWPGIIFFFHQLFFFSFIKRLELEVDHCRKQQPFQIQVGPVRRDSLADAMEQAEEEAAAAARGITLGNYFFI